MAEQFKRKQIYINMDLQFKYSLVLIFTMFVEMIIVGVGLMYVFSQPKPDVPGANIYFIYKMVLAIILFLTLCNITVGVYLSHKVAGPLFRFILCTKELANGNLRIQVNLRKGDEMRDLELAFNEMTERFRDVLRQDRQQLKEIEESAGALEAALEKSGAGKADKEKVMAEINSIREKSRKINTHFTI